MGIKAAAERYLNSVPKGRNDLLAGEKRPIPASWTHPMILLMHLDLFYGTKLFENPTPFAIFAAQLLLYSVEANLLEGAQKKYAEPLKPNQI